MTTFNFEGKPIEAEAGDTVASALLRAGIRAFSRGPKYHRPRGPFCFSGTCAQCHMRIGSEPNLPACLIPVTEGLKVERQNVLGSGDTDLLRAVDFLYPEGIDHHHLMTTFKLLNTATKAIARRLAGIGELPEHVQLTAAAEQTTQDLVVIGAGRAGLAAARAATERGVTALVLDAEQGTRVVGLYEEGGHRYVAVSVARGLVQVQARVVIVATGGHERPLPFEANDLPGIFGGRGLLKLIRRHGVKPGKRAVVLGSHPDTGLVADGLREAGIEVAGIVAGDSAIAAVGRGRVKGLRVRLESGDEQLIDCDLIAVTAATVPNYELAAEVGAEASYREAAGGFVVITDDTGRTGVEWLFAAGSVTGAADAVESGRRAGAAAASVLERDAA